MKILFLKFFIEPWLRRCTHRPEHVTADILEGDENDGFSWSEPKASESAGNHS